MSTAPAPACPGSSRRATGGGFVLAAGEREHARVAVLDRDRRVEQRGDRVREREQVPGRQPAQRFRVGDADIALGQAGTQQRGELCPRSAADQAEQRDPGAFHCVEQPVVGRDGRAHHETGGVLLAEVEQHLADRVRIGQPDGEDERVRRQHRVVERVVDDQTADVVDGVGLAVDKLEQRHAEVVEDPAETGAGSLGHRYEHHLTLGSLRPA